MEVGVIGPIGMNVRAHAVAAFQYSNVNATIHCQQMVAYSVLGNVSGTRFAMSTLVRMMKLVFVRNSALHLIMCHIKVADTNGYHFLIKVSYKNILVITLVYKFYKIVTNSENYVFCNFQTVPVNFFALMSMILL